MLARQDAIRAYRELELRMIRDTVNGLFNLMRPHYDDFPKNYVVFDLETTGINPTKDLIVQLGWCIVKDGKEDDRGGAILKWPLFTKHVPNPARFKLKLEEVKNKVEWRDGKPTGKKYHFDFERVMDEGVDPMFVLEAANDILHGAREKKMFFIAHNGYHFDVPFLEGHFDFFLGKDNKFGNMPRPTFHFGDNELFDTGMVEKGSQCQMIPWLTDTVRSWSLRTQRERIKNVKWALDTSCVPRYDLDKRYNLNIKEAHDAGFDCYVCHLLFQEYVRIASGADEPLPLYRTNAVPLGAPTPTPPWEPK